jgi:hypothetical protein
MSIVSPAEFFEAFEQFKDEEGASEAHVQNLLNDADIIWQV